jgi:hypothetical protein
MSAPTPPSGSSSRLALALASAATLAAAAAGYLLFDLGRRIDALGAQVAQRDQQIQNIHGEVTRLRLEQSAGVQGPSALLAKLKTYAPLLVSARTTQPDFESAKKEMDAVLRAFATMGDAAWGPLEERMKDLKGDKNFDELKWLLEAAVRVDQKRGLDIVQAVLRGTKFPAPRLRWYAARMLIDLDKPVAQAILRQILSTESSRGINPERAAAYGATIPDPAAFATTGFHNFVNYYVLTEDPQMDSTLLMVMGRSEHDTVTVQTCVEVLGKRRCAAAVDPIQKLFQNPPGMVENPIFQTKCLDALLEIQGKQAARPFFEAMLAKTTNETVANNLKEKLK